MLIKTIILVISGILSCVIASPVPNKKVRDDYSDAKVLYDQRQEGAWNVRAHLDNFVIMIIPTQTASSTSSSPSSPSLLDFLTKSIPTGSHLKRMKHAQKQRKPDAVQETMHFIESKTAPYHVDLTKEASGAETAEKGVVASSPSIALIQSEEPVLHPSNRRSRQLILTLPLEDEYVLTKSKSKLTGKKSKEAKKETHMDELTLLGAQNEQCGPGMARDSYGICRTYKKY
ncbi:unnamed protein product [Phaedon cochleariae]|uniref:Uncharacterized protein n=1 Tax=Phaedon cochleariae TaxID=80249 RepID=A0A9P0GPD7_PHACE|nr:unnamed protein product [Phaedon cochleariae]